jgi:hypothetical protein
LTQTILGLPIESELPEDIMPFSAIAVVKAFDSDGDEVHAVIMTDDMTPFEGSGLLNFGSLYTDELLRRTFSAKGKSSKKKQVTGEASS